MKWAFIDYENISDLSKVQLASYERIIVFLGAKQSKLDFTDVSCDQPLNIVLIQLKTTQANNLDFHLAYYLGKFDHQAASNITFEVISNDTGYTPLIAHINKASRPCKQIKVNTVIKPPKAPKQPSQQAKQSSTDSQKLITCLTAIPPQKRPKKVASLGNYINTHLALKGNEAAIQQHLQQLVNAKLMTITGTDITYKR